MKTLSKQELDRILADHALWLKSGGSDGKRADLSDTNLDGVDLRRTMLDHALLDRASLVGASLRGASLRGASLKGASLVWASLNGASLDEASLDRASLNEASLNEASLDRASLVGASLVGASLENTHLPKFSIVPEVGPFTAFKALRNGLIAELYVPRSARRVSSLVGRKCRVSKAKVRSIYNKNTGEQVQEGFGVQQDSFRYTVGAWVKPDKFDDDIRIECTNGIHCFITKKEAEEYGQ